MSGSLMKWAFLLFVNGSFVLPAAAADIARSSLCAEILSQGNGRFQFGQVTHSNLSAQDFFASPVTLNGKPRLIVMVGIPGSGKTTWSRAADVNEWEIIRADDIRSALVKKRGMNPSDASAHFDPTILRATQAAIEEKFKLALQNGKGIVLDQNNLTPLRIRYSAPARQAGYHVEGLIFSSEEPSVNIANVKARTDHQVQNISDDAIVARFDQFRFFNERLRVASVGSNPQATADLPSDIQPFLDLAKNFPTLNAALSALPYEGKSKLERLLAQDVFSAVELVWTPSTESLPLDSPVLRKRPRLYAALTNKCNRACPWCCVYSNPSKNTFLEPEQLAAHFPADQPFDLQLEGGEPTIHPKLFEFVDLFRRRVNAGALVLVTNGVKLPRAEAELKAYLAKFGEPFTLKLSVNHYLLERDKNLLSKAAMLKKVVAEMGGDRKLILNVRLRKGERYADDSWVLQAVKDAGLADISNVFFLQSYGLATNEENWEPPFTVTDQFVLINPDGSTHSGSLTERADKMGQLK